MTYKHKNLSFTILTSGFRMKSPFCEQLFNEKFVLNLPNAGTLSGIE
ncbi:hypothetical protein LEP1GSC071_0695 [Leptospira santarosai str. JET]|nr:hypothetical protein LEP1GSC071_0695 [Leptospira santarosai str. JET]EPG83316.1 hypothetical protein LEP1GSC048_2766 [Leptospira santarosai serovar Shermani str. 1342KT]